MKGKIIDYRIRVKPSQKLIEFILNLESEQVMPQNILKIIQTNGNPNLKREILETPISTIDFTADQIKFLEELEPNEDDYKKFKESNCSNVFEAQNTNEDDDDDEKRVEIVDDKSDEKTLKEDQKNKTTEILLELNDLRWLRQIADKRRKVELDTEYLHELLEKCEIILPENEIIPRNPELEARCQRLRAERDARQYREMTKNVDTTRKDAPEDSIGYQLKAIDRQLIAVLQFIFSVAAGFAFGFIGVELIIGNLDFGFRLLLGIMCALTIAVAEIYFLAKKLHEYDEITT